MPGRKRGATRRTLGRQGCTAVPWHVQPGQQTPPVAAQRFQRRGGPARYSRLPSNRNDSPDTQSERWLFASATGHPMPVNSREEAMKRDDAMTLEGEEFTDPGLHRAPWTGTRRGRPWVPARSKAPDPHLLSLFAARRPFGFRPEAPESIGEVSLRVQEDVSHTCRGSTFSTLHLSPGFSGPKHALISWMGRKKEAWSREAEEP